MRQFANLASLVPKLCLGTPSAKLRFASACCLRLRPDGKQSFPKRVPKQSLGTRVQFAVVKKIILALCATLALGSARADDAAAPDFVVQTSDGKAAKGRLRELGPDWSVRLGDGALVDGAGVLSVRQVGRSLPSRPVRTQLLLAGGDCFPVDKPILIGERVHFHSPHLANGTDASAPLSSVQVIWFMGTANESPERLRRRLLAETRKRDVVLLRNGDVLEGVLTTLDEKTIGLEVDKKPVAVDVSRTAAVALSSDLTELPRPKGVYGRVILNADGARISLASAHCADGVTLTGTTLFGAALSVPLTDVAALDLFQGKAVYLSDLKPSRYEYLPYLNDRWDYVRDGSGAGLDLRLVGSTYDKGVGLHSHSRLSYAAPKDCRRFEALVGLDDRAGRRGSARIRVLADGKPLDIGADRELTAAGAPLVVRVELAGAKELTMEVDFGKDGPVRGCVDWADARFVK
jgi:NPCBM/NEW2 domain